MQFDEDWIDQARIAKLAQRAHHNRHGLGHALLEHLVQARYGLAVADGRQRIDRALADPPVLVLGGLDQVQDGAFILGLVQDLDRRAPDVLIIVLDQLQHGVDHLGPADLAERVGGTAAHPPVAVGNSLQQVFHGTRIAHFIQDLDRGAARVLVFILQDFDQILDRIRVVCLDDYVNGAVLDLEFRITQQFHHRPDVERTVHARQ